MTQYVNVTGVTTRCDHVCHGPEVGRDSKVVTTRQQVSINSPAGPLTMDRLESLGNTISNITLYDIKSMYTQVRLVFARIRPLSIRAPGSCILIHLDRTVYRQKMSCSMSARWRPRYAKPQMRILGASGLVFIGVSRWCADSCGDHRGASSTLMQEIAQGYVFAFIGTSGRGVLISA